MIAQLSPSAPLGSPSSSSIGVRWAGYFSMNSWVVVLPQTSSSSKSRPAARTRMRTVRLLTLGFRMLIVFAAIRLLRFRVLRGTESFTDSLSPFGTAPLTVIEPTGTRGSRDSAWTLSSHRGRHALRGGRELLVGAVRQRVLPHGQHHPGRFDHA